MMTHIVQTAKALTVAQALLSHSGVRPGAPWPQEGVEEARVARFDV